MNMNKSFMEQGSHEQEQHQIAAFHELLNLVNGREECPRSEQYALAFIIEDMAQKKMERWKNDFLPLKEELFQDKETGGLSAVTWRLAREFHDRYDAFLAELETREQNPARLKNIKTLRRIDNRDMDIRLKEFESGRRVPVGSVIMEHVPKWIPRV